MSSSRDAPIDSYLALTSRLSRFERVTHPASPHAVHRTRAQGQRHRRRTPVPHTMSATPGWGRRAPKVHAGPRFPPRAVPGLPPSWADGRFRRTRASAAERAGGDQQARRSGRDYAAVAVRLSDCDVGRQVRGSARYQQHPREELAHAAAESGPTAWLRRRRSSRRRRVASAPVPSLAPRPARLTGACAGKRQRRRSAPTSPHSLSSCVESNGVRARSPAPTSANSPVST